MISSEVQRTLVKSPPELWAELSDPATLARLLGELGEIRITRVDPEQAVEWEAEHTRGTVRIKPSGWGTKVALTVTRRIPELDHTGGVEPTLESEPIADREPAPMMQAVSETPQATPEPQPTAEAPPAPVIESEPPAEAVPEPVAATSPEPLIESEPPAEAVPEPVAEPATLAQDQSPRLEPRRGFLSRLFRRRQWAETLEAVEAALPERTAGVDPLADVGQEGHSPESPAESPSEPPWAVASLGPATETPAAFADVNAVKEAAEADPERAPEPPQEAVESVGGAREASQAGSPLAVAPAEDEAVTVDQPASGEAAGGEDIAAELKAREEVASEQVTAVLTSVLDRLGAAHHRPFSRG
jgi:hypothetical protein